MKKTLIRQRSVLIRRAMSLLIVTIALCVAQAAFALGKDDIRALHASGLGPDVIRQVILSSTEPIRITPQEVDELRAEGIPESVLETICQRVGCVAAPGPGPVGPGPGPSLDQEMLRQQELEAERMRIEQERMEREREAMRERIQAEQARDAQVQQAFGGLTEAQRLYRAGSYARAAGAYNDFLVNQAPSSQTMEYYEALTGFVRSMHAAGYRHTIRQRALEAVLYGPASTHFEAMFGILRDIANEASYLDPQFETLTGYTIGQYSREFQDQFNFFLGRFFWIYGETNRSLAFFDQVSSTAEDRGRAHYLAGTMLLAQNENRRALREFQEAIQATQMNGTDADVAEIAFLALARVSYEVGQFDAALYYYQQIPRESPRRGTALFESTWANFLKQDWNRAIGGIHTLQSPYYAHWFHPELFVIEAASYLYSCNLDQAEDAIAALNMTVEPIHDAVKAFIASADSPEAYWNSIMEFHDREGTSNPVALPVEAVRHVLSDINFANQLKMYGQLTRERDMLSRHAPVLGVFGETARASIDADLRRRQIDGGLTVSRLLGDFERDVEDWLIKGLDVGIEINSARFDMLGDRLAGDAVTATGTTTFVLAQDWQFWPFEGEYWIDEVGNYRATVTNLRDESGGRCLQPPAEAL